MTFHPTPRIFLNIRAFTFSVIVLVALLIIIFLAIVVFTVWDFMGMAQNNFILVMFLSHSITSIVLLVLLLLPFRPWLDAARVLFVFSCEISLAIAFTVLFPGFICNPSGINQCKTVTNEILIISWVVPSFLLLYLSCLGFFAWKSSFHAPLSNSVTSLSTTVDDGKKGREDLYRPAALFVTRPNKVKRASQTSSFFSNSPSAALSSSKPSNENRPPTLELQLDKTNLSLPNVSTPTSITLPPTQPHPGTWDARSHRLTASSSSHYSSTSASTSYSANQVQVPGPSIPQYQYQYSIPTTDAPQDHYRRQQMQPFVQRNWSQQQYINRSTVQTQASNPNQISPPRQFYQLPNALLPTSNYYYSPPQQAMSLSRPVERAYYPRMGAGASGPVRMGSGPGSERRKLLAPGLGR